MTRAHDPGQGARLMLAFQEGDEGAFDRLVETHSGRVFALLTRFLGPVPGREDLVQEVFLRLLRARGRYTPSARFSTFLYRIVFNLCVNERERRPPTASLGEGPDAPGAEGWHDASAVQPSEELERNDVVRAVRRALDALPDRQRMALVLARYDGLSFAEIAAIHGSTERAIKSLVHRARENMRTLLAPFLTEVSP